ncbi:DUF378 domain-containing protein [Aliibacillus thermotolerans]|uniref:DUF378 domain-containing protein n=1 Tax=Aliibacillus thermotolerans TaxID=1834418 RepID=A0ABW0U1L0_9BACI|nr:DUF378 domain-containing protein [Aliibacillus thermotolerans]MDA3129539.1 DUF378 domain-containing protein [Aliibacillus thermotolerans]
MRTLQRIALALVIIGAINWGLIGLFDFDLVAAIFGGRDALFTNIIYILVGISGLICLSILFRQWEETEELSDRRTYDRPNYGTEFGEETDLSSLDESPERED